MPNLVLILTATCLIALVVLLHHESLSATTRLLLARHYQPRRWRVGATVLALMAAHILEVLVFAVGLYIVGEVWGYGALVYVEPIKDANAHSLASYVYFSFTSYTSLGIGDIYPQGMLRLLTGIEGLLGLLMIGWTASFLYLEMRAFWRVQGDLQGED